MKQTKRGGVENKQKKNKLKIEVYCRCMRGVEEDKEGIGERRGQVHHLT